MVKLQNMQEQIDTLTQRQAEFNSDLKHHIELQESHNEIAAATLAIGHKIMTVYKVIRQRQDEIKNHLDNTNQAIEELKALIRETNGTK